MDTTPNPLYCGLFNSRGGEELLDLPAAQKSRSDGSGTLWLHLDVTDKPTRRWLERSDFADHPIIDALLADETRPRSLVTDEGMLVVLRGVNTNPGEDPEDMVSIRLWIERNRIISTRRRKLLAITDIRTSLADGRGPRSAGEFLITLIEKLADRIGGFVDNIEDRLGDVEESIEDPDSRVSRQALATLRRQIASVRRFLAPQRDALDRLYRHSGSWLSEDEISQLREESDRITRHLEDLDLARERAVVLQEEYLSQLAQEQNTRMYVLSVVAAVFLPLGFLTGLLGMNVGGLPGVENARGFLWSVGIMIASGIGLVAFFRWKKWI